MLHEAQQQCGAQTGDTGQEPDEDDSAAELEGAPTHALDLCAMAGALYRNGLDCIVLVSLINATTAWLPVPAANGGRRSDRGGPFAPGDSIDEIAKSTEPRSVPTNLTPVLGAIAKPEVFVNGCVLSWRDVSQPECVSGDVEAPTTVALVGDSHAAMWHPALEPMARERHWRLETEREQ